MPATMVARTTRQILRETTPDDAEAMFALNADPEVLRHTGDAPFASVEAARAFLANYDVYAREGMGRWAALDAATGEVLGWCGLRRQPEDEVDLGYRYRRAVWGRGLATEAGAACLDLAFGPLALGSVIARAHPDNAASIRVMVKLGMRFEALTTFQGTPAVQYRIRAEEWRSRRYL